MVVILLLVIIAILLFGAAAVRGAIAGVLLVVALLLGIGIAIGLSRPYLGEEGLVWIILGGFGLLALWGFVERSKSVIPSEKPRTSPGRSDLRKPVPDASNSAQRAWERFSPYLAGTLDPMDQATVDQLIRANNADRLVAFCCRQISRRYPQNASEILLRCVEM